MNNSKILDFCIFSTQNLFVKFGREYWSSLTFSGFWVQVFYRRSRTKKMSVVNKLDGKLFVKNGLVIVAAIQLMWAYALQLDSLEGVSAYWVSGRHTVNGSNQWAIRTLTLRIRNAAPSPLGYTADTLEPLL